jgi:GTP cyclohydrolase IA
MNNTVSTTSGADGHGVVTNGSDVPDVIDLTVPGVDRAKAEAAVRLLLEALGEDPDRDGLLETPKRVAKMWSEVLAGYIEAPEEHLAKTFEVGYNELVLVRDIPFTSLCEHHMLPFIGHAHVAYLPGPDGRVVGLSKLARVVEGFARRLQVQERLNDQVADAVAKELGAEGVCVVMRAEHYCMAMRGVRKAGASTVTMSTRGIYRSDRVARAEVLAFINGSV